MSVCMYAQAYYLAFPNRDFLLGLHGRGVLRHHDTEHTLIEIGFDLILVNGIG